MLISQMPLIILITAGGQYSALRQLPPAMGLGSRRTFPPAENPWTYVRTAETDVEFSMTK